MKQTWTVESNDQGAIHLPQAIKKKLGLGRKFKLKFWVDTRTLVAEPTHTTMKPKSNTRTQHLSVLANQDTSWFDDQSLEEQTQIRQELEAHANQANI